MTTHHRHADRRKKQLGLGFVTLGLVVVAVSLVTKTPWRKTETGAVNQAELDAARARDRYEFTQKASETMIELAERHLPPDSAIHDSVRSATRNLRDRNLVTLLKASVNLDQVRKKEAATYSLRQFPNSRQAFAAVAKLQLENISMFYLTPNPATDVAGTNPTFELKVDPALVPAARRALEEIEVKGFTVTGQLPTLRTQEILRTNWVQSTRVLRYSQTDSQKTELAYYVYSADLGKAIEVLRTHLGTPIHPDQEPQIRDAQPERKNLR